jgi:hypothetical protein
MLAFKATDFSRFRYCPVPADDFTWTILDTGVALDAFFRIDAEF